MTNVTCLWRPDRLGWKRIVWEFLTVGLNCNLAQENICGQWTHLKWIVLAWIVLAFRGMQNLIQEKLSQLLKHVMSACSQGTTLVIIFLSQFNTINSHNKIEALLQLTVQHSHNLGVASHRQVLHLKIVILLRYYDNSLVAWQRFWTLRKFVYVTSGEHTENYMCQVTKILDRFMRMPSSEATRLSHGQDKW